MNGMLLRISVIISLEQFSFGFLFVFLDWDKVLIATKVVEKSFLAIIGYESKEMLKIKQKCNY